MQKSLSSTEIATRYNMPVFCAFIVAGLAGNYFSFPLFMNIDFLFGSIFAMLALQFLSLGLGIVSAGIIASSTYFLWNHPYSIIILTAELGVVGWQMKHGKSGLVLADTLYWLIIGMPLVYFFYHFVMHVPQAMTNIVMIKQCVNGIFNALIARLIFIFCSLRSRSSLISSKEILSNLLAFFVFCPSLIILAIGGRSDFTETDKRIQNALMQGNQRMNEYLKAWAKKKETAITTLSDLAASKSPDQMQAYLELSTRSDPDFLRIGQLNKDSVTTAYYPLHDEFGKENIGKNFADRPFIQILKQTRKPMLSEIVMGRIGKPEPIVEMLAPILILGEYAGFTAGIISLEHIRDYLDKRMGEDAMLYILVDKNGNIIMTNHTDEKIMTPFKRSNGTIDHLVSGIDQWFPLQPANISLVERWKDSFYLTESTIGNLQEWKLIIEQPVAPFYKTLYAKYTGNLSLLFIILTGALALAELLSRRSIMTLRQLSLITHDLPSKLAINEKDIIWPGSGIEEINYLIGNFKEMANSLTARFNDIRQINESLEIRVEKRTEELRENEEKYRILFQNELYAICIFDIETLRFLDVNDAHVKLYGYDREELMGGMRALDLSAQYEDSESSILQIIANGAAHVPLRLHKRKDGSMFPVEIVAGPYTLQGKKVIFALTRDNSEIKQAEIELQENEERFRKLFEDNIMAKLIIDPDSGKIIEANSAASKFYGWSIEKLTQMFIWDINTLPVIEVKKAIAEARSSGTMKWTLKHLRSDGSLRDVEVSSSRIQIKGRALLYSIINDVTDQKSAEEALKNSNNVLEQRVTERTSELEKSNATLSMMLDYARKAEADIQERVVANLRTNIFSLLDSLKKEKLPASAREIVELLQVTTQNLAHPLARNLESNLLQLTAREIHLANLIRLGKSTKDLIELLNVSPKTIESHRNNLRKKLGIRGKKINLRTYLDSEFNK